MDTVRAKTRKAAPRIAFLSALALLTWGCEAGTGGPGAGTVGGSALGAGVGRAAFGNSTSAMLIGGAVGGLIGNQTLDRQAEERRIAQQEATRDRSMQRQLEFERQRALQRAEVEREIEEQRLFNDWLRQQGA